jgi:signal transduction histidine kinase
VKPETAPPHAWDRALVAWDIGFWIFVGLGLVTLLTTGDLTAGRRFVGVAAIVAIGLAYRVIDPRVPARGSRRNRSYLLVLVVAMGVGCAADPTLGFVLFIAYPQIWIFSESTRNAVLLNLALTGSTFVGFMTADGWTTDELAMRLPEIAVSLGFSLLMGIWIARIIDQSLERAQLIEQLEATRTQLGEAHHAQGVTAERERMAREIHDTLAQGFTSIIMLTQAVRAEVEAGDPQPATDRLEAIELVARENLGEARALVAAFSPVALEGSTLTDAVRRLAERFGTETGVAIDVEVPTDSTAALAALTREREVVLLRAAQEALTNVRRHARARLVTVRLSAEDSEALVEVQDDGVGFEPGRGVGFGLTGMRDRAHDTGGELDVSSAPGQGTRVRVRVPAITTATKGTT